jgi:type III secretion system low calcium response chaperone LcrH/SycD
MTPNFTAKQLSSGSVEALYSLAYMHYKQGKYQEAVGLFRLLTMSSIKSKKHWMGLAASLQMLKQYQEAVRAYEMAAALDPTDPYIHIYAADCFFAQTMVQEGLFALDCAERAMEVEKKAEQKVTAHIALMRKMWDKPKKRKGS